MFCGQPVESISQDPIGVVVDIVCDAFLLETRNGTRAWLTTDCAMDGPDGCIRLVCETGRVPKYRVVAPRSEAS